MIACQVRWRLISPSHLIFLLQHHWYNHQLLVLVFLILGRELFSLLLNMGQFWAHSKCPINTHCLIFNWIPMSSQKGRQSMTEVEVWMKRMNAFSPNSFYSTSNIIPGPGNLKNGTLMLQHDWKSGIILKWWIKFLMKSALW